MSDETIELARCPFCGHQAYIRGLYRTEAIVCTSCGANIPARNETFDAQLVAAWNRRHTDAAPGEAELYARLEELAKAIMRRPAPYSDELGRKHYELAHDTLKLLRARRPYEGE